MRFIFLFFIIFSMGVGAMPAHADMIDLPEVKIQVLDKSTARTTSLRASVGSTIKYGSLYIKAQACRQSEPLDKPENAAFLQIWEIPVGKTKSEWAFSGWMFSSSPALSAMDHAVYDVWVLECYSNKSLESKKEASVLEKTVERADDAQDASKDDLGDELAEDLEQEESDQEVEMIDSPSTTRINAKSFDNVINDLSE